MRKEYIIIGDSDKYGYKECLVCLAGNTKERAEEILNRMLIDPNENDKKLIEGHSNLKIKEVDGEKAWWNDPFLCN